MPKQEIIPKTTEQQAILEGLQRKPTNLAVLLYSAGADSTATGMKLIEDGYKIQPLVINYGQSAAETEIYLATTYAQTLGFEQPTIIQLAELMNTLSDSMLCGGSAKNDQDAWVPARNTIFMVIAGSMAYKIDADGIAVGLMLEDNGVFGDSNLEHHSLVGLTLSKSLSRPMKVFTPLQSMTKMEVLRYLLDHDALQYTTSCWNAIVEHGKVTVCNECANCIERNENLRKISDTTNAHQVQEQES